MDFIQNERHNLFKQFWILMPLMRLFIILKKFGLINISLCNDYYIVPYLFNIFKKLENILWSVYYFFEACGRNSAVVYRLLVRLSSQIFQILQEIT